MTLTIHTVSQAIRSLGRFRPRYQQPSPITVDSAAGRLLLALLLTARHRQQSFDASAVERFRRQYQRQQQGVTIELGEAEHRQWLRYVLGRAVIPRPVSAFGVGRQDRP